MKWTISGSNHGPFDIQDEHGNHVATISQVRGGLPVARMIGAAQEMFDLLDALANEMQSASSSGESVGPEWLDRRIRRARKVLKKIEGRKP